jgi:acetate kinase
MIPDAKNTVVLLTLNVGSSSIKFALFSSTEPVKRIVKGQFDDRDGRLRCQYLGDNGQRTDQKDIPISTSKTMSRLELVLHQILELIQVGEFRLQAIVHRVVHGGGSYNTPTFLDQPTVEALEKLVSWAPLHQPECLRAVRLTQRWRPNVPQIACFDTAFHHTLPDEAAHYAIPRYLTEKGIRRYGFHGLSYQSVWRQLREHEPGLANGRWVVAHLGGGSSLCGILGGRSIATTMGMTPLDGLPMATRCGALDPGVVLHLLAGEKLSGERISELLYRESGLLGVSQVSGDMRTLLADSSVKAKDAVRLYVHRVAREIGSLFVDLQGLDGLVFTGGIGENSTEIREMVCERLRPLGVAIDPARNAESKPQIHDPASSTAVWCLHSDEELEMARQAISLGAP